MAMTDYDLAGPFQLSAEYGQGPCKVELSEELAASKRLAVALNAWGARYGLWAFDEKKRRIVLTHTMRIQKMKVELDLNFDT